VLAIGARFGIRHIHVHTYYTTRPRTIVCCVSPAHGRDHTVEISQGRVVGAGTLERLLQRCTAIGTRLIFPPPYRCTLTAHEGQQLASTAPSGAPRGPPTAIPKHTPQHTDTLATRWALLTKTPLAGPWFKTAQGETQQATLATRVRAP
jgi:hypothetical protein